MATGNAGCNRYFASIAIEDASLDVGPIGATRMACSPELMELEQRFTELLQGAASYEVRDGQLVITSADGQALLFQTKEASVSWVTISAPEEGAKIPASGSIRVSGEGEALTVELTPGNYVLLCNIAVGPNSHAGASRAG